MSFGWLLSFYFDFFFQRVRFFTSIFFSVFSSRWFFINLGDVQTLSNRCFFLPHGLGINNFPGEEILPLRRSTCTEGDNSMGIKNYFLEQFDCKPKSKWKSLYEANISAKDRSNILHRWCPLWKEIPLCMIWKKYSNFKKIWNFLFHTLVLISSWTLFSIYCLHFYFFVAFVFFFTRLSVCFFISDESKRNTFFRSNIIVVI